MHAHGAPAVTLYDFIHEHFCALFIFALIAGSGIYDITMTWLQRVK